MVVEKVEAAQALGVMPMTGALGATAPQAARNTKVRAVG